MKTFADLVKEVQEPGLCHHCGGCVTFCTAVNYGALAMDEDGRPHYRDRDKCIECGICYAICPEITEHEEETKSYVSWTPPMGRIRGTTVARSLDPEVRAQATDGGVVTGLLLGLLDKGHIDGAIVAKKAGPFKREPWLALTRDDLLAAAGFHFDTSHGMERFSQVYSTYSPSVSQLEQVAKKHLTRVAIVGTPCQINTLRRMEVMGIVPTESIKYYFGLFCAGNFMFGEPERRQLEGLGNFTWPEVRKINLKEELMIHLRSGEVRFIPLNKLDFMKRHACNFCSDYAAEFADLSFGGIGAEEGWTTVITRSQVGETLMARAMGKYLEEYDR
ncbi:MAG: Coenzyme F420 hydrogenase/dehydrogenase, beta subunit C-terminal domain, partial [Desulfobaccales bacterium]